MSDSPDRVDDDITFTIGKGNQSSICGGVVPMDVVDPKSKVDTQQTGAATPANAATPDR